MKQLEVPFIGLPGIPGPATVSPLLDQLQAMPLSCNPWPEYKHKVQASFVIAHNNNALLLKYYVSEKHLVAAASLNGDIHKDSCVEFFVAFGNDRNYYNLELNCVGWFKTGYGYSRDTRAPLPAAAAGLVTTATHIAATGNNGRRLFTWELSVVLPAAFFCYHHFNGLSGLAATGNFYKCGDETPAPHFLTWNKVLSPIPDFHRKEDFGKISFL